MNLSILGLDLLVLAQPRWLMLALLLLIAAVIDAWQWRIPNALTFGGSLAALASSLLEPGSAGQAVLTVLAGLSVGMLLAFAAAVYAAGWVARRSDAST